MYMILGLPLTILALVFTRVHALLSHTRKKFIESQNEQIGTLKTIDLSHNYLSSIPDGFITDCGEISGLKLLNFSVNRLVGSLPNFTGFRMTEHMESRTKSIEPPAMSYSQAIWKPHCLAKRLVPNSNCLHIFGSEISLCAPYLSSHHLPMSSKLTAPMVTYAEPAYAAASLFNLNFNSLCSRDRASS
ncbi:unnamed protein product [Fraxinus pennsylvanica]|uniref:Uncharacterized protein n=1 Tax=Fraxinus pennsylvanica TaxID=56036 RepID=A0AAD1ZYV8_9LAMI|nr:unnamed protein product [Fraxinus pennsylvanica]